ncbi:MAG: phosphoenolpyruvate carboxykinase (ATP) [Phycisphaerales bacterium]|nr:phosphoenolpyruvate carboxykinase (ATP) [Phycisphaerae bacterium]NNF41726.1 phosphoenolpyruvate carboxykinase (ATP) [Phycisphaerales bacterium]NNM25162.1 phosphoenolpyruvate carboxykinase (ATP) [Phycisphaerales bacterium]
MSTATAVSSLRFGNATILGNRSTAELVERSLRNGEGVLAANGALCVDTGRCTGRMPNDKYLEDTPGIHDDIAWGKVNQPIAPEHFAAIEKLVTEHMSRQEQLYRFDGFAGADTAYRLKVSVIVQKAWHCLFAKTLFINADTTGSGDFDPDWVVVDACGLELSNPEQYGLRSPIAIIQSLEQRKVFILGTQYAGEMKKSIFYAMNYDLPSLGVFPMHCSCNVAADDPSNVALFFGLSGTGKTTLSADPNRPLIGDDEHGWSDRGIFNIEGGCYAKCIGLTRETEPQIWDAIRFGSVLENVVLDDDTRVPDYDDGAKTENTRVTYPVQYIPNAVIPSVAAHAKNVLFLAADAFGVLPPVSKLTPEQAMYYFVNGYTSKLAGTEAGVTEPQPNFSPCFGGPFLPRPPMVYAEWLARRIREQNADVWLLNTGWTGGPHGVGKRFKLAYTRAFVTAILDGSLRDTSFQTHPIFGLSMPVSAPNVPADVLDPRRTWADGAAYDMKAKELAGLFRANDVKFEISDEVRTAGPSAT